MEQNFLKRLTDFVVLISVKKIITRQFDVSFEIDL